MPSICGPPSLSLSPAKKSVPCQKRGPANMVSSSKLQPTPNVPLRRSPRQLTIQTSQDTTVNTSSTLNTTTNQKPDTKKSSTSVKPAKLSWWKSVADKYSGAKNGDKQGEVKVVVGALGERSNKSKVVAVTQGKKKKVVAAKGKAKGKAVKQKREGKKTGKCSTKRLVLSDGGEESEWSDDSELSACEIDFCVGEEELDINGELFDEEVDDSILKKVEGSLKQNQTDLPSKTITSLRGVDDVDIVYEEEDDDDSDELRSLEGSDDEVDNSPVFNPDTDFKKKIELKVGLKFSSNTILRKALVHHAIENRYDFYYLHSGNKRVTTYCRYRCDCEWDKKKIKFGKCHCNAERKCAFRVYAAKSTDDQPFQIRSMNLKHTCGRKG